MPNRLFSENSLYLKQHAANPVDWYPWGDEAFAAAGEADKPILVSIGYSACHWCHVMAHECFEDDYIAGLMNQHFVCIKVDREERPDIDQIYMEAIQMIQHSGGWPLNVFCLPDGRPFSGGTYFPPEDRGNGMIPWPQLLMRIADFYKRSRKELEANADSIQENMRALSGAGYGNNEHTSSNAQLLIHAAKSICEHHDDMYGGFGNAPKFPPAMTLNFLNVLGNSHSLGADPDLKKQIKKVCHTTLRAMAHGGIFDQFGGGFARYSVDRYWLTPHFEKMLYDNALLIDAYTRGWLDNHNPLYAAIVEETIGWLEREMLADGGVFYAALDADSDGGEGRYYVWTPGEIKAALGSEDTARRICRTYNITEEGTFEKGASTPSLVDPDMETRRQLAPERRKLLQYREANRSYPGKDTKVNAAWNCMLIRATADAGFYFNKPEWLQNARKAADFIWENLVEHHADGIRMKSVFYKSSGAHIEGFLHDYALAAEAFLAVASRIDLLDAGAFTEYLERAEACIQSALRLFNDSNAPGFFFADENVSTPSFLRHKEWFDNATPSGNSALLHAFSGLYALKGITGLDKEINTLARVFTKHANKFANGVTHALEAVATDSNGIVVVKVRPGASIERLQRLFAKNIWRRTFIHFNFEEQSADYQVCVGSNCLTSTNSVTEVAEAVF